MICLLNIQIKVDKEDVLIGRLFFVSCFHIAPLFNFALTFSVIQINLITMFKIIYYVSKMLSIIMFDLYGECRLLILFTGMISLQNNRNQRITK
jgi:hypothetical protein